MMTDVPRDGGSSLTSSYLAGGSASTGRHEADVNIEFQSTAELVEEAMELAFFFKAANDAYATDITDDDFRLGLNAGQTTLAAVAQLAGASIVR